MVSITSTIARLLTYNRPEEFLNESERKHVDEEVVDRDSEDSDNDDDLFVNPNHAYVDSDDEDYDNDDEDD